MKRKTSILGTLTARTFRRSKSRNLVAILAILLTTMMFTTLFTLSQSMGQNMTEMYLRQAGTTAHTSTKSILDAEIEKIVSHPDVVSWGKSILVGTVENQALAGRQVEIRFASDSYAESCFASPTTGRLPQRADEIALDTQVLHRLGISPALGQTVTLSWRPISPAVHQFPTHLPSAVSGRATNPSTPAWPGSARTSLYPPAAGPRGRQRGKSSAPETCA